MSLKEELKSALVGSGELCVVPQAIGDIIMPKLCADNCLVLVQVSLSLLCMGRMLKLCIMNSLRRISCIRWFLW